MKSRRMWKRVLLSVDTFNKKPFTLIDYYLDISGQRISKNTKAVHFPAGQTGASYTYEQDSVLKKVYTQMVASQIVAGKPDRKLNIFEVNVTSTDEKFSKVFT